MPLLNKQSHSFSEQWYTWCLLYQGAKMLVDLLTLAVVTCISGVNLRSCR